MASNWRLSVFSVVLLLMFTATAAGAQGPAELEPALMQDWLALTAHQEGGIVPGTRITMGNWRHYQQYMPLGMIELFRGTHFWKMPQNVEIDVGPTVSYPVPRFYVDATEKNSSQVRVVHLPDGNNDISNYAGGEPFTTPQEPDKGYKLLTDLWFGYALFVGGGLWKSIAYMHPGPLRQHFLPGRGVCLPPVGLQHRSARAEPGSAGAKPVVHRMDHGGIARAIEVHGPVDLVSQDNQRNEELYVFLPSLRRSIRLSAAARCTPVLGTDYIQDDYKSIGFNGGIAMFDAKFLGRRKILTLFGDYKPLAGDFPNNYYMPLGWPKPSWGAWQLRDVDVIDVRRVPSKRNGYCVGSRIIYEDAQNHYALWEESFDINLNLWKVSWVAQRQVRDPAIGFVPGPVTSTVWDVQNDHMTNVSTQDKFGHDLLPNSAAPAEYRDFNKYATPGGLAQILQ